MDYPKSDQIFWGKYEKIALEAIDTANMEFLGKKQNLTFYFNVI